MGEEEGGEAEGVRASCLVGYLVCMPCHWLFVAIWTMFFFFGIVLRFLYVFFLCAESGLLGYHGCICSMWHSHGVSVHLLFSLGMTWGVTSRSFGLSMFSDYVSWLCSSCYYFSLPRCFGCFCISTIGIVQVMHLSVPEWNVAVHDLYLG